MRLLSRVRKTVSVATASVLLLLGGAAAANAETWTQGPVKWQHDRNGAYCGVWAYNDYNWWEEVFQGKRDGWEREWWALC
jgi:hypothetical protein